MKASVTWVTLSRKDNANKTDIYYSEYNKGFFLVDFHSSLVLINLKTDLLWIYAECHRTCHGVRHNPTPGFETNREKAS